jgi:hypothetical protein
MQGMGRGAQSIQVGRLFLLGPTKARVRTEVVPTGGAARAVKVVKD